MLSGGQGSYTSNVRVPPPLSLRWERSSCSGCGKGSYQQSSRAASNSKLAQTWLLLGACASNSSGWSESQKRPSMSCVRQFQQLETGSSGESSRDAIQEAIERWDHELDEAERQDAIRRAVLALPEREKFVVALHYYENLTDDEIAEVMDIRPLSVTRLRMIALAKIRRQIGAEPFT